MSKLLRIVRLLFKILLCLTPWALRRPLLQRCFGYKFDDGAKIAALSWIYPDSLSMGPGSKIGSLNVAIHLHHMSLGESASIARGNWITGHPKGSVKHFLHREARDPSFCLGRHSAITKSHLIDCTDRVQIGNFTTVAGYRSQFLTHSIDIYTNRQDCKPIIVGDYCFVGTGCVLLSGAVLPDRSVLGALSVLNKAHAEACSLYAGNPARHIKQINESAAYFHRQNGYVY